MSSITAPGGETLSLGYDGFLPTSETWSGSVAGGVARTYDDRLLLETESVNGALTVLYTYDDDEVLESVGALDLTPSPQHGLLLASAIGTRPIATSQDYTAFGELSFFEAFDGAASFYREGISIRDKLGRIRQRVETMQTVPTTYDYTYDLAGRLETVSINAGLARHYRYDDNGNRLSLDPVDPTPIAAYDAQDRLGTYGTLSFGYTGNGELVSKTDTATSQTTLYGYDELGNLLQVALPGGPTIDYAVDGRNRRIAKQVNGTTTKRFVYRDGLNIVAELDAAGAVLSRFVYGAKPHVPDYLEKGGASYRIVSDHLGSVRLVVDVDTGTVAQRIDYDEFGNVTADSNPGFQPFGFAGGLYDPDTGLTRFGARDYDPLVGRWTAKDPVRFEGGDFNLFGYVQSDPVNFIDIEGFGKQRPGRSSEFIGLKNEEVSRIARDRDDPRRQKAIAEEKDRKIRNTAKRGGKRSRGGVHGPGLGFTTLGAVCSRSPEYCAALFDDGSPPPKDPECEE